MIENEYKDKITIVPVSNITEVLSHSLVGPEKKTLIKKINDLASYQEVNMKKANNFKGMPYTIPQ